MNTFTRTLIALSRVAVRTILVSVRQFVGSRDTLAKICAAIFLLAFFTPSYATFDIKPAPGKYYRCNTDPLDFTNVGLTPLAACQGVLAQKNADPSNHTLVTGLTCDGVTHPNSRYLDTVYTMVGVNYFIRWGNLEPEVELKNVETLSYYSPCDPGYVHVNEYISPWNHGGSLYFVELSCAAGETFSESEKACKPVIDPSPPQSPINSCSGTFPQGNPIYPLLGGKREVIDMGLRLGLLDFKLTYDSIPKALIDASGFPATDAKPNVLGTLWSSTLHRKVLIQGNQHNALVSRGDGRMTAFAGNGNGIYTAGADNPDRLLSINGGYLYFNAVDQSQETYNAQGKLTSIKWANGSSVNLMYNAGFVSATIAPGPGYLLQAQDNQGRSISFRYNAAGRLTTITDSVGRDTKLSYDGQGNLSTITWADNKTRLYLYESADFPWALTGVSDENSVRYATFGYDAAGRAISTEYAQGVNKYSVSYTVPPIIEANEQYDSAKQIIVRSHVWALPQGTSVSNPHGDTTTVSASTINGKTYLTSQSQPAGSGCSASTNSQGFDPNGNLSYRDDFNGTRTCYIYDVSRNFEVSKVEGLSPLQECSAVTPDGASLPVNSRKLSTQWHPDLHLSTKIAEPGKLTSYVYNGQPDPTANNAIAACAPANALLPDGKPIAVLCKQVEQATTDTNGSQGLAAALDGSIAPRISQYTYDAQGRVLTAKDSLNRTTTYAYYPSTAFSGTDPNAIGHTAGDLYTITDPQGFVTHFDNYDKAGRVLSMTDPKGIVKTLSYTPRGWINTVTVTPSGASARVTTYTYDGVGQVTGVSNPDGTTVSYTYDDAHRLVGATDARGNSVSYTLDNAGNRINEQLKDPGGVLQRTISRSFDALNRVQQLQTQ